MVCISWKATKGSSSTWNVILLNLVHFVLFSSGKEEYKKIKNNKNNKKSCTLHALNAPKEDFRYMFDEDNK